MQNIDVIYYLSYGSLAFLGVMIHSFFFAFYQDSMGVTTVFNSNSIVNNYYGIFIHSFCLFVMIIITRI